LKRLSAVLLCMMLAASCGCAPTANAPSARTRIGEPVEDLSARQAMTSHLQEVWPGLVSALASETAESPRIPEAVASGSVPGSPTMVWGYAADFPEGADVWEGVARVLERNSYVIPVVADGEPIATFYSDDYSGTWRVWRSRDYAQMAPGALDELASYFGSADFEWCYVNNGGMWVVARHDGETAGVYIDPIRAHRVADPPTGVLSGAVLRAWMDDPLGP